MMMENPEAKPSNSEPIAETETAETPTAEAATAETPTAETATAETWDEGPDIDIPRVIEDLLKNPPLLPNESKDDFDRVYDDFLDPLMPETVPQHWLVWNSAILTWEVMRYRRMKVSFVANQRRAAVSALIRYAFPSASMRGVRNPGSDIDDNIERYFSDPAYPPLVARALAESGYSVDAVEAEMFARSLAGLGQIEKLIASAEKRLMMFFREMEKIHGDRAVRAQKIADDELSSGDE
jgi:hypothetical protein